MNDVIVAKFDPPVWMGDQIHRVPLLERLNHALSHRLTLIHAPAGYGKTSLLAQWRDHLARQQGIKAAWLTLDHEDYDIKRLVQYLSLALHSEDSDGIQEVLSGNLPPRSAMSALVNILARDAQPVVLIIDDLHHAASEPVIDFLQSFIRLAPSNCHFVIASRDYPSLGQAVLAAEEQFLEITVDDLKFSSAEAASLFARSNQELVEDDIGAILDRTEGWPIALQLTSLSLKRGVERHHVIDQFSGSSIELARYLSEQVLIALPDELREIVIRTALLDRLNGELVNLLCDRTDGWMILEKLERQGVFLTSVSADMREYRYHQLFAEYLRDRFERSDLSNFLSLQSKVAYWFAGHGQIANAVHHAILAKDDEALADIVEQAGGWRLIPQGQQTIVERGLAHVPDALIKSRPRLALAQVYLQIKIGELGVARVNFDRFAHETESVNLSADLKTEIRVVADTLADYENQPMVLDDLLAREALLRKLPANDHLVLANISETLGAKYFEGGWLERALQPTLAAREHYQSLGSLYSDLFTRFLEARIKRGQGRSKEAWAILESARENIVASFGEHSDLAANCAAFQAELLYEQDRVSEARELLDWALPHMEQSDGWVDVYAAAYFTQAKLLASEGAFDDTWAVTARARRLASRRRLRQLELLADICEVELRIFQGFSLDTALKAAATIELDALADMMDEESPLYRPVAVAASLCRVKLRLLSEEYEMALAELERLRSWADQRGAGRLLIDVNIMTAFAMRGMGEQDKARSYFDEAVGIAMFQDIVRPFIDARQFVQPCLDDALEAGVAIDRFRDQFLKSLSKSLAVYKNTVTVLGLFSESEAEVLYHLSQGHSNKEIARLIGMSPDTVKYRLKSVFRKIGVTKRRDAVRISVERGLVPAVPAHAKAAARDMHDGP